MMMNSQSQQPFQIIAHYTYRESDTLTKKGQVIESDYYPLLLKPKITCLEIKQKVKEREKVLLGELLVFINDNIQPSSDSELIELQANTKIRIDIFYVQIHHITLTQTRELNITMSLYHDLEILKRKINTIYGGSIQPERQKLEYEGELIEYKQFFKDYKFDQGAVIVLKEKRKPANNSLIGLALVLFIIQMIGSFIFILIELLGINNAQIARGGIVTMTLQIWGFTSSSQLIYPFYYLLNQNQGDSQLIIDVIRICGFFIIFTLIIISLCGFGQRDGIMIKFFSWFYTLLYIAGLTFQILFTAGVLNQTEYQTFYQDFGLPGQTQSIILNMIFGLIPVLLYIFSYQELIKENDANAQENYLEELENNIVQQKLTIIQTQKPNYDSIQDTQLNQPLLFKQKNE
ncbi:hypothetical protein PPERSA_08209 [Pseudocohnilembus persalinus]|uniref:Ubiquitin-like domain-containing protein n=1 Tax=Pseudocohnilembus persalinus TaxID=266149 RepID=A0A0V0QFY5_PSEPJ|nr:hypothetical protein PPERSA_08209 [Pseudocohnilembus persalinus]|eukprot:KRX01108.1 hypothetical protein PPERSA_08209 [Pseudocohnilembus persalinus]